ncbi:hypothetical protein PR202_ga23893 [Eleusine coracana subsp. coracana]|uniref:KIB1-4 beta-propeller domain-containing protein n=1 Tax=Eleusine coracana subsp. coracana TaxID=191504 RepID=A0AAV5D6B0_ELECO|nr:hypothetical protein PR202_ga23893 [Eleusine coracana subsp. coracana]
MDLAQQRLVQVKDLRGHALFLGFNGSFFLPVTGSSNNKLKANCIYHTDDNIEYVCAKRFHRRHVVAFSLDENVFTQLFTSSSRLNWPPPIWIRPSRG